jgi:hypothetical protein
VDATPAYDTGSHDILPAGWRSRLLSVAVIGAMTAVVTLVALLPVRPAAQAQPRYYLTISQTVSQTEAAVLESVNGKVTGQVAIPTAVRPPVSLVTGAADDRSFIIGVYQDSPAGSLDLRLFRLRITAAGRAGSLTELPWMALPVPPEVQGIALSSDGILLAVSLRYQVPLSVDPLHYGGIEVINLVTGTTHL